MTAISAERPELDSLVPSHGWSDRAVSSGFPDMVIAAQFIKPQWLCCHPSYSDTKSLKANTIDVAMAKSKKYAFPLILGKTVLTCYSATQITIKTRRLTEMVSGDPKPRDRSH